MEFTNVEISPEGFHGQYGHVTDFIIGGLEICLKHKIHKDTGACSV